MRPAGPDPYLKQRLTLTRAGRRLSFEVPHSVFATDRIDAGTLLLLDWLPPGEPETFLDLGCGYGALGLSVASSYPRAHGLLVDRDLLAVEFCARNAEAQAAVGIEVRPGLGFRDIPAEARFDWILCNVPARAGERVLESFVQGGRARLRAGGELRIVVISDLAPRCAAITERHGLAAVRAAEGENHVVFAFPPGAGGDHDLEAYERDRIDVLGLSLARPTDLADEPARLRSAIPFLAECLPALEPRKVLCFRCGYGLVPALALRRYPNAKVIAADRDLLATAFTLRNCAAALPRLATVESVALDGARAAGPFDLVLGELSPPLGRDATLHELVLVRELLAPGGSSLVLATESQWRGFLNSAAADLGLTFRGSRSSAVLLSLRA